MEGLIVFSSFIILGFVFTALARDKFEISTLSHFTNEISAQRKNVELDSIIANISSSSFCNSPSLLCSNTKIQPLQKLTQEEIQLKQGMLSSWISACKPIFFYLLSFGFFLQSCMISYEDRQQISVGFNYRFLYFLYYSLVHIAVVTTLLLSVWFRTVLYAQFAFVFPLIFVYASNTVNNFRNMQGDRSEPADISGLTFYNKRYMQDISAFSAASNSCMFLFLVFVYNSQLFMTTEEVTLSFAYFLASQLLMNIAFHIELKSSETEIVTKRYMLIVLILVAVAFLVFSWINVFDKIVVLQESVKHLSYNSKSYHLGIIIFFFVVQVMMMVGNVVVLFVQEKQVRGCTFCLFLDLILCFQNLINWNVLSNRGWNYFFIMYGLYVIANFTV